MNFEGWSSDLIVPYGRQMICFSSDADSIEAFDRNTGETIWRSEMTPIGFKVDYILGVYNDMLYAAGRETIVAYDLKGEGRMIWGADQVFDGKQSLGRGMLTPDGVYIPVEDSIYQFGLLGKVGKAEVINKVHVDLGTNAPVGNLYSDGERFWVHGANRLYALGPAAANAKIKSDEGSEGDSDQIRSESEDAADAVPRQKLSADTTKLKLPSLASKLETEVERLLVACSRRWVQPLETEGRFGVDERAGFGFLAATGPKK
ncbi:MAG: hypothetical protein P8J27_06430 [Mariniblastus sp.]|nr:hypothetical protein [Mariniblastus sp.]